MVSEAAASEIEVRAGSDGIVLRVTGELDMTAGALFEAVADALPEVGTGPVTIDITEVGFVDIRGCRDLLALRSSLASDGREVHLVAGPTARRVVDVLGVRPLFCLTDA